MAQFSQNLREALRDSQSVTKTAMHFCLFPAAEDDFAA